jgi:hypothetical protein
MKVELEKKRENKKRSVEKVPRQRVPQFFFDFRATDI